MMYCASQVRTLRFRSQAHSPPESVGFGTEVHGASSRKNAINTISRRIHPIQSIILGKPHLSTRTIIKLGKMKEAMVEPALVIPEYKASVIDGKRISSPDLDEPFIGTSYAGEISFVVKWFFGGMTREKANSSHPRF